HRAPHRNPGKAGIAMYRETRWRAVPIGMGVVAVAAAVTAPRLLSPFILQFMINLFMLAILAESWNIIGGFTGYASFGNVAFFGIGAYATGVRLTGGGARGG